MKWIRPPSTRPTSKEGGRVCGATAFLPWAFEEGGREERARGRVKRHPFIFLAPFLCRHRRHCRPPMLGDEMTAAVRRLAISLPRSPEEEGLREREVITIIRATCGVMTSLLSPRGGWTDPTSTYPVHSLLRAFSRVWTLMLSPPAGISPNLWPESLNHSASSFPPSSASR